VAAKPKENVLEIIFQCSPQQEDRLRLGSVAAALVVPVSWQNVRDCLYRGKDVGGRLCHIHISHLVHPKTLILDRLEHAQKRPKNLANTFFDALVILNFFCRRQNF